MTYTIGDRFQYVDGSVYTVTVAVVRGSGDVGLLCGDRWFANTIPVKDVYNITETELEYMAFCCAAHKLSNFFFLPREEDDLPI